MRYFSYRAFFETVGPHGLYSQGLCFMTTTNPPGDSKAALPAAKPKRFRRFLKRLMIVAVVGLILAEIGLRLILGLGPPVFYQPAPACGYLPKPDQNTTRFFAHNQTNAFSMRSDPISATKDAGHYRVMFI